MEKRHVLVIDAEPQAARYVSTSLRARDYVVVTAADGSEGLKHASDMLCDVVILDVMLPDTCGFELCQTIRQESDAVIMVLSALNRTCDIVRALDCGADDYLTKPFDLEELLARLRAVLRRAGRRAPTPARPPLVVGDLALDFTAQRVLLHGRPVQLTRTEYELLAHLALHSGRVLTHRALLQAVWGPAYGNENEYLWTYIRRLRYKIEPNPRQPRYLLNQPGVGYYLVAEE